MLVARVNRLQRNVSNSLFINFPLLDGATEQTKILLLPEMLQAKKWEATLKFGEQIEMACPKLIHNQKKILST